MKNTSNQSSASQSSTDIHGCRVLVADDFDDGRIALGMALECEGFKVRVCGSPEEVVALALEFQPEIILLDLDFGPVSVSGYEIARRVRETPALYDVTLVAVSGWSRRMDLTEAFTSGFDHYFVKPVDACEIAALTRGLGRFSNRTPPLPALRSRSAGSPAFPRSRPRG